MTIDSPFTVRPLTDSDREWLEAFTIEHWGAKEVVVHGTIFLPATMQGFVAELGDLPMGVITYQIRQSVCELVTLNCVVKRQGIGTALVQVAEEAAQKAGCRRITLVTTNDNLDAMRFYQRRGYRLSAIHYGAVTEARNVKPAIPVIGDYGITLQDEVVLEKQLNPHSDAPSD